MQDNRADIFHVHTYRCRHAANVPDEAYVTKALSLGADSITFTDHAPFPGDPFLMRMKYNELEKYISDLTKLKVKYRTEIDVRIGLECEYFPEYLEYYKELRARKELEVLLLGQHMYPLPEGGYSFSLSEKVLKEEEYKGLGTSIVNGINSGLFDAVAHPDRIFRRKKSFGKEEEEMSREIISAAVAADIPLEVNLSSIRDGLFYPDFWDIARNEGAKHIYGYDAHEPEHICLI